MRGFQISCATPVTDGMVVNTQSPNVKAVQDGVLEFLLINHPLDCPVCDRGGECPLQDQTLAFGPGESRFVEEKRHFEKPMPISDLVLLDRERCIQCGRCTRFAAEIAGDPLIDFGERGGSTQVITYPDEPFSSYFSGNTVQICPVGALTASAYRFRARPWDLQTVETSCQTCAVGCRGALQSTSNRIVRLLGVDSEPVNQGWLCDKGRYGYEWVHAPRPRPRADGAQGRRAGRGVVAGGARRRGRPVCGPRSTPRARRRSRCSVAPAAPTRTPTCGRASPRACSAPTTSTRSSATAFPPRSCSGLPGATIADLDRARGRRAGRARPPRGAAGPAPQRATGRGGARRARDRDRAACDRAHPRRHRGVAPRAGRGRRDGGAVRPRAGRRRHRLGQRLDREGGERARRSRRRHRRRARPPVAGGVVRTRSCRPPPHSPRFRA